MMLPGDVAAKVRTALADAENAMMAKNYERAWPLLLDVGREFAMRPALRQSDPRLLERLISDMEHMARDAEFEALTKALKHARKMLEAEAAQ